MVQTRLEHLRVKGQRLAENRMKSMINGNVMIKTVSNSYAQNWKWCSFRRRLNTPPLQCNLCLWLRGYLPLGLQSTTMSAKDPDTEKLLRLVIDVTEQPDVSRF